MGPTKTQPNYKKDVPTATWLEWKKEKKERKAKKNDKLLTDLEKNQNTALEIDEEAAAESKSEEVGGRTWTVSIALPGNILDNAQTPELRAALAGQIARAAAIFNIDEVTMYINSEAHFNLNVLPLMIHLRIFRSIKPLAIIIINLLGGCLQ